MPMKGGQIVTLLRQIEVQVANEKLPRKPVRNPKSRGTKLGPVTGFPGN